MVLRRGTVAGRGGSGRVGWCRRWWKPDISPAIKVGRHSDFVGSEGLCWADSGDPVKVTNRKSSVVPRSITGFLSRSGGGDGRSPPIRNDQGLVARAGKRQDAAVVQRGQDASCDGERCWNEECRCWNRAICCRGWANIYFVLRAKKAMAG